MAELWRVGTRVPINVYDENGAPVCQCQTADYARRIVNAVNAVRSPLPGMSDTELLDRWQKITDAKNPEAPTLRMVLMEAILAAEEPSSTTPPADSER
jgi:hypothetical protein